MTAPLMSQASQANEAPVIVTPPRPGLGQAQDLRARILRVDHAGELAAVHIYQAQAAVFANMADKTLSQDMSRMQAEEQVHLDYFEQKLRSEGVRPTLMAPIWRLAALGLGATTALMGEKCAHACTEAVESVIEDHYAHQIKSVQLDDLELAADLSKFRDDEIGHRDHAIDQGAKDAPAYPLLSFVIKAGCKLAIKISEKI